jgi:hypothetical protein
LDLFARRLQSLLITINTALSLIYTLSSSTLHTHQDSPSSVVVSWQRISPQKLALRITTKSSCYFLFSRPGTSELKVKTLFSAAGGLALYSRGTEQRRKHSSTADHTEITSHVIAKDCWVVTSLRLRGSVFTESLRRSGLFHCCVLFLWLDRS